MKTRNIIIYAAALLVAAACNVGEAVKTETLPPIYPDYAGVTVPRGIAPLNFEVEGATRVAVEVTDGSRRLRAAGEYAHFPIGKWHRMLSRADELTVSVRALQDGIWKEYLPFGIYVSGDPIDAGIAYRRVDPGYELYAEMGLYQRTLGNFNERLVYRNDACINCHSFAQCDPSSMQLHLRGPKGGTFIRSAAGEEVINMKNPLTIGTVYPYWHPSGRYVAYSVNDIKQSFHNLPGKVLEVYDLESDVVVYDVVERQLLVYPQLQDSTKFMTFPSFSPDGGTLYFCCTGADPDFRNHHYSLCSVPFDPLTGKVGDTVTTLWSAEGRSASFPRPSYDGKYIMFTVSDFGNFSIWHPEADLWLLDLRSGEARCISEINSGDTESYHSWSSGSRWTVFSSRRDDGRYTRLYLSHLNDDGSFTKPFMLPQRKPVDNLLMLQSYNIPEFCSAKVSVPKRLLDAEQRNPIEAKYID